MTADTLTLIVGSVLSLVFGYFPGLEGWYTSLKSEVKALIMIGLLLLTSAVIFGINCLGWAGGLGVPEVACTEAGLMEFVKIFFVALAANQSTYLITAQVKNN